MKTLRILVGVVLFAAVASAQCAFKYNPVSPFLAYVCAGTTGPGIGGASSLTGTGGVLYDASAGTAGVSTGFLRTGVGKYTLYDPTATTGSTVFTIKPGAGQASTNLFDLWLNTAGSTPGVHVTSSGNLGLGTAPPIGKFQGVISTTAPFIVGGATVGSYTAITSPTANKDYLNKTGIGTASTVGDLVVLTAGTGVYTGVYSVAAILSADSIQISRECHASGADVTDVAVSISTAPRLAVGTNRSYFNASLSNATSNETAFRFDYTTNKATSGNDTGLQINYTRTAAPGTSYPLQININGSQKFAVDNAGAVSAFNGTFYDSTPTTGDTQVKIRMGAAAGVSPLKITNKADTMITEVDTIGHVFTNALRIIGGTMAFQNYVSPVGVSLSNIAFVSWSSTGQWYQTKDLALYRASAGVLEVNNGTVGTPAAVTTSTVKITPVAIGSLPTCNAGAAGTYAGVTDALTPVPLATVVAGGAVKVPVYCDGSNWIVM